VRGRGGVGLWGVEQGGECVTVGDRGGEVGGTVQGGGDGCRVAVRWKEGAGAAGSRGRAGVREGAMVA